MNRWATERPGFLLEIMMHKLILSLAILATIASCKNQVEQFDLLLTNANIVAVESGTVSSGKFIGISGDTIRLVGEMKDIGNYGAVETIDAENQFVLPGLWDMHVHFRGGDTLIAENKALLPLYLAYGVTTVRDAGGDITSSVLEWRKDIRDGRLAGPDIFTSGPKFDGSEPAWTGSIALTDIGDIGPALDSLEAMGVDYIKTYDGSLTKELFYELIRQTQARGLKITGHMPFSASIMEAINLGLDGTEHLYYLLNATSPIGDSLAALDKDFGILPDLIQSYDPNLARINFGKIAQREFYATPTLYIGEVLTELHTADHSQDNLLPVMGPGIQKTYARRENSARNRSEAQQQFEIELEKTFRSMVKPMYEAGINVLAGSDCGPYNSYVYPGESLQAELFWLVNAGLTPQQALSCSVINGPKFFGLSGSYGSVAAGKVADLLVLGRNPLDDIKNISDIKTVIANGKIYGRARLESLIPH